MIGWTGLAVCGAPLLVLPAHGQNAAPFQMQEGDLKNYAEADKPVPGPFQVTEADVQAATRFGTGETATGTLTQNTGETAVFTDDASGGLATIVNNDGGATRFYDTSTAQDARIENNGTLQFSDSATAGSATIVSNQGGVLVFTDDATAGGTAAITNNGTTVLLDRSALGTASFVNNASGELHLSGQSQAGTSLQNSGLVVLSQLASLGGAGSFVGNNATGSILLRDNASAGAGNIGNSGLMLFVDQAVAGTAGITNNQTGTLAFLGQSSADQAQQISNAGKLYFGENASAGSAVILTQTGGQTVFYGQADGGLAEMRLDSGSVLDFSLLDGTGTSVGSLQGTGTVALGSKALTVGGNNLTTTASGIQDGGLGGGTGGSLVKTGTGTLELLGTNSYTGLTRIEQGRLLAASAGALAPQSGVVVSAGALLDIGGTDQAIASLAGAGNVETGASTLTLGADGTSTTFSGALLGAGGIAKVGAGTLTLSGTSSTIGTSRLVAGGLRVDGSMAASTLDVGGSTLSGSGTLGTLNVLAGGTVNPGNGANLTIASDLLLNTGATYRVDITEAGSDSLTVLGNTGIADADLQIGRISRTDPTGTYTILSSANPIMGQFAFASDYAFLLPSLDYQPNTVALTIARNGLTFSDVALTPNQRATALALEGFAPTDPVFSALLTANLAEARRAYDLASGEVHAAGPLVNQRAFDLFADTLGTGQLVTMKPGRIIEDSARNVGVASLMNVGRDPFRPDHRAWVAPMGAMGQIRSDGNGATVDWSAAGLAAGAEVFTPHANGHALAGVGVGYIASEARIDERLSTLSADGAYIGVYGQWRDGPLWLDGRMAYGAAQMQTRRDIVIGALTQTAEAEYWTQTLGAAIEARYEFELAQNFHLGPVASLDIGWSGHGGAEETGAGSLNQTLSPANAWRFDTGLGLAARYDIPLDDGGVVSLTGKALWQHALADTSVTQTTTLAGGGGPFEISGPDAGRDRLRLMAGLAYRPNPDVSLALDYAATLGGAETSHAARFALRVNF